MRLKQTNLFFFLLLLCASALPADPVRMAALEARLAELEARLATAEQETQEVKVLAATGSNTERTGILSNAATLDIISANAWRKLRWTQQGQWDGIRKGITEAEVVELLGKAPRSVKSLKPRVDKVLYYETSVMDRSNGLRGSVSFRDGRVVAVTKPNF